MASVYSKNGVWYLRVKDPDGKWLNIRCSATTKPEARRLAMEVQLRNERVRLGLEQLPADKPKISFGELIDWWWKEYGGRLKSKTLKLSIEKHLRPTLGHVQLTQFDAAAVETVLLAKETKLAPSTLNHLRSAMHRMFELARKRKFWRGENPIKEVERRKVPKKLPNYLRFVEVPLMLAALDVSWRPLFATAVFTGMRRGELLGLRKEDIDFESGTIAVVRSHGSDTTKGKHAELLPIANGLFPYLRVAVASSPSTLVFPDERGKQRDPETKLDRVLRRALGRAGIVTSWKHICRRKKCRLVVEAGDPAQRLCDKCGMKLWLKPVPRHVRFHDLRHTTATLLLKASVPLATVQRILRHTDPALTSEIYGHLDVDDMRAGVNKLTFEPVEGQHVVIDITPTGKRVTQPATFATRLLPAATEPKSEAPDPAEKNS